MEKLKAEKFDQKVRLIFGGISLLIVIGVFTWSKYYGPSRRQSILDGVKLEIFHGKAESIYRDKWDHNVKKVILSDGTTYGLYPEWEESIELGDSLVKVKDSVVVKVYKKNGKIEILNYKQLVKNSRND